ncbi:Hypothetical protein CINCED_3A017119 [Cinara cedri]|uniref:Uncharacterized protein n=1 Tax=Cinara cedri TaxID=506608 RepID=A0A5E4N6S2_9HEMI|nr:Hypothetical protein CINCED_3A017119 [Cinara cedri]
MLKTLDMIKGSTIVHCDKTACKSAISCIAEFIIRSYKNRASNWGFNQ